MGPAGRTGRCGWSGQTKMGMNPDRGIVLKTHNGLFERIVWRDIFLTPGRFVALMGNHKRLTPLSAQLRDCPMGRRWAWPDDTTPDTVPLEHITC